jgi:peptidoglycan/LPS O-acetylase OafA/YrhL
MNGFTPARRDSAVGNRRVVALDSVRGLACLLVLCWHYANAMQYEAWPLPVRGLLRGLSLSWSGVDLFFVLSGFLLGGICLRHRQAPNFFAVFYARRIFRVFPLYFVWVLLGLALPLFNMPAASSVTLLDEPAWPYAVFLQNWYFAARGSYGSTWLAVTWSLAVEEQFYLLLPALIRWVPAGKLGAVLIALIAAAPVARAGVIFCLPASSAMAAYWLLPCRWDALFLGVLAALWTHRSQGEAWASQHLAAFKLFAVCTGAALLGLLVLAPDKRHPLAAVLGFSLIDLFFAALVVYVAACTTLGQSARDRDEFQRQIPRRGDSKNTMDTQSAEGNARLGRITFNRDGAGNHQRRRPEGKGIVGIVRGQPDGRLACGQGEGDGTGQAWLQVGRVDRVAQAAHATVVGIGNHQIGRGESVFEHFESRPAGRPLPRPLRRTARQRAGAAVQGVQFCQPTGE